MRKKDSDLMNRIIEYVDNCYFKDGSVPSVREIANALNVSKSCIGSYILEMEENGLIERDGVFRNIKTKSMKKIEQQVTYIPIIGSVACGEPLLAEQNIETYLSIPIQLLGSGKFFILKAKGDSMINAGISEGDYVIVRQQNTAEVGQIVVALIDDEATLKRFYIDNEKSQIRLHAENDNYSDMFFDNVIIQGVAVKIIKNIE